MFEILSYFAVFFFGFFLLRAFDFLNFPSSSLVTWSGCPFIFLLLGLHALGLVVVSIQAIV